MLDPQALPSKVTTFPSIRILDRLPTAADFMEDDAALIVCLWMHGFPAGIGPWLAALSVHDCNAVLEQHWVFEAPAEQRARCFFGVFVLDRLRSTDRLFALLRERGVDGIVNFPSVSFFDGATAQALASLGFSEDAEARVLGEARATGLRVGLCTRTGRNLSSLPPDLQFQMVHDGPGRPLEILSSRAPDRAGSREVVS